MKRIYAMKRIKPSLTTSHIGIQCQTRSKLPPLSHKKHFSLSKSSSGLQATRSTGSINCNTDDVTPIEFNLSFPFRFFREEIHFPLLPPLPPPLDPNFPKLFSAKIKICSQLCDFSVPDFEIEAKNIKSGTLAEFIEITCGDGISTNYIMDLFNMVCANIFRKLPVFPELYLYSTEEFNSIDSSWSHIGLCYTILQRLMPFVPTFDEFFLSKLASRLYTPLRAEQDQITSFLTTCITEFPYTRKYVRNALLKILVDYLDLHTYAFAISPTLTLLSKRCTELEVSTKDFMVYVVPLVTARHLRLFVGQFQTLLGAVLKREPTSRKILFDKLASMWPSGAIYKQAYFCRILVDLAEQLDKDSFAGISHRLALILSNVCTSPNEKVAEEAIIIWSRGHLLQLVENDSYSLLPQILEALLRTSYDHWSNTVRNNASAAIQIIKNFAPDIFQEVTRKMIQVPKDVNEHLHTSWTQIAKKAAEADMSINIIEWIEKINLTFPPEQYKRRIRNMLF